MRELGRTGWAAALFCTAVAACSVNGGVSSHDSGSGGTGATGSGGTGAVVGPTDGPPIAIDGGSVRAGSVRMIVPAYWDPDQQWQRIIADAPTVGMIIFNPDNGPGTATNAAYTAAIAQAQAAGIIVLGYVSTQYGQRAEGDIDADVNGYYQYYAPSGIYFAEGPTADTCDTLQAEYERLAALAHSHDAKAYVAIGTRFCPTFITFSDLMVEFAETLSTYEGYTSPSWMPRQKLELLVVADPHPTTWASLAVSGGRRENTYLLPVCSQFESSGSRVASNRSIQWGEQIVKPIFEWKKTICCCRTYFVQNSCLLGRRRRDCTVSAESPTC